MRYHTLIFLTGAVAIAACLSPTDGCGCPPAPASALIAGTVRDTAGAPVANATVLGYVERADGCIARSVADGLATTDAAGRYRLHLAAGVEAPSLCVLVRARAPLASGPAVFVDTAVTLALRHRPPLDSTGWTPVLPLNPAGAGP